MARWKVEFWPGKTVEIEQDDELGADNAVCEAIIQYGWIGGSEHNSGGEHFQLWVTKIKDGKK